MAVFYATWCAKGREILLVARDRRLFSVAVERGAGRLGTPHELFRTGSAKWLAPAPDGQRFLVVEPEEPTIPEGAIQVNVNWTAGLRP
jgi:hypothetical protein